VSIEINKLVKRFSSGRSDIRPSSLNAGFCALEVAQPAIILLQLYFVAPFRRGTSKTMFKRVRFAVGPQDGAMFELPAVRAVSIRDVHAE
jgi:hypothetical protein